MCESRISARNGVAGTGPDFDEGLTIAAPGDSRLMSPSKVARLSAFSSTFEVSKKPSLNVRSAFSTSSSFISSISSRIVRTGGVD